jgi:glycerol-3-phosphate dehydrogenase
MTRSLAERRAAALARLEDQVFDLLVIGGGIVGSRVAFDGARAGLAVALVDKGDFGGATSAASSKLVHGGLRYLATGDLRLVRELQRERAVLGTQVAPHLVRPLRLVLAVERSHSRRAAKLAAALALYAAVSGFRRPWPRLIRCRQAMELVPFDPTAICACGLVEEASTHDARLALATARAARDAGVVTLNHVSAVAIERSRSRAAVAMDDRVTGERLTVRARSVVNACGPWVDRVRQLEDPGARPLTRLSKGVHVVLPLPDGWQAGLALFDDSRSAFTVPWQGMLLLGATDTPVEGPTDLGVTDEDIETLLGWFRGVLPEDVLQAERIVSTFAGLRVLAPGRSGTARASRRHLIAIGPGGTVSIAGGKLTSHRTIALDALAALPREIRPRRLALSAEALPGARLTGARAAVIRAVGSRTADHLLGLYGGEAVRILDYVDTVPDALEPLHPDGPDIWAQAHFALDEELAVTAEDIAIRRTTLGLRGLASADVLTRLDGLAESGFEPTVAPGGTSRFPRTPSTGPLRGRSATRSGSPEQRSGSSARRAGARGTRD